MNNNHKRNLVYFLVTAVFFLWLGLISGIGAAEYKNQQRSEQRRIEMLKDSLYHEYIKQHDKK